MDDKARRAAAMYSVYFHAHSTGADDFQYLNAEDLRSVPSEFRPIPIEQAAKIIHLSDDREDRLRAIAKLEGPADLLFEDALGILTPGFPRAVQRGRLNREKEVYEHADFIGALGRELVDYSEDLDKHGVSSVRVKLRVEANYVQVSKAVDPRGWDDCTGFFPKIFLTPTGQRVWDRSYDLPDSNICTLPSWESDVFEHFQLQWNLFFSSFFKNVLHVRYRENLGQKLRMDFALGISTGSRVLFDPQCGGIDVDSGYAEAVPIDQDNTELTAEKKLRFTERAGPGRQAPLLNLMARVILQLCVEEQLHRGATCDLPH